MLLMVMLHLKGQFSPLVLGPVAITIQMQTSIESEEGDDDDDRKEGRKSPGRRRCRRRAGEVVRSPPISPRSGHTRPITQNANLSEIIC